MEMGFLRCVWSLIIYSCCERASNRGCAVSWRICATVLRDIISRQDNSRRSSSVIAKLRSAPLPFDCFRCADGTGHPAESTLIAREISETNFNLFSLDCYNISFVLDTKTAYKHFCGLHPVCMRPNSSTGVCQKWVFVCMWWRQPESNDLFFMALKEWVSESR